MMSLQRKSKREKDKRQDFRIYDLFSTVLYLQNDIEWMEANSEFLDEQINDLKRDVEGNHTYVTDLEKELFDKYQQLANSLVWAVRGHIDNHKEYKERVAKKQKNTYKAVASLLKYLADGFDKSIKTLNEYKQKVADSTKTSLSDYNSEIMKTAKLMRLTNNKAKKGVKIVKKKMGKSLKVDNQKLNRLFSSLERNLKTLHRKGKLTIDANVRLAKQKSEQLAQVTADLEQKTAKFKGHYAGVVKKLKDMTGKKRMEYAVLSEKLAGELDAALAASQKDLAGRHEDALKRLEQLKKESVARVKDKDTNEL